MGVCGAVVLVFAAGFLRTFLPGVVSTLLLVAAAGLWFWAMGELAAGRGYHPALGVIFALLGFGILILLLVFPDKTKKAEHSSPKDSDTQRPVRQRDSLGDLGKGAKY